MGSIHTPQGYVKPFFYGRGWRAAQWAVAFGSGTPVGDPADGGVPASVAGPPLWSVGGGGEEVGVRCGDGGIGA